MGLKDQIMSDVKVAMKAREQEKLTTLRMVHAAIKNKEIELRPNEISEQDTQQVLKKLMKQAKDSIEQFENAGRQELADKEKFELNIIQGYLPEQLSEEKVVAIVEEVIANLGATDMKQMGAIMKEVTAKTNGAADNKLVSQLVRAKLQS